jgi:hypothetical protein
VGNPDGRLEVTSQLETLNPPEAVLRLSLGLAIPTASFDWLRCA